MRAHFWFSVGVSSLDFTRGAVFFEKKVWREDTSRKNFFQNGLHAGENVAQWWGKRKKLVLSLCLQRIAWGMLRINFQCNVWNNFITVETDSFERQKTKQDYANINALDLNDTTPLTKEKWPWKHTISITCLDSRVGFCVLNYTMVSRLQNLVAKEEC